MGYLSQDVREIFGSALKFPEYKTEFLNEMDSLRTDVNEALAGGGGTVTSVGLSLPSIFTVSNSPVTVSGTLTAVLASQSQNLFFASPNGSAAAPSFRAIVSADIPTLNQNTTGTSSNITGTLAIANGGSGQTTANLALNAFLPSQTGNAGEFLTTDGTNTSWSAVSGGANTTLSNLGVTAINADLIPAGDYVQILGSASKNWLQLFVGEVIASAGGGGFYGGIFSSLGDGTSPSLQSPATAVGASGDVSIFTGTAQVGNNSGNVFLNTANSTLLSGNIDLTTGNGSGAGADSGSMIFQTGTATDVRGTITLDARRVVLNPVQFTDASNKLISNVLNPVGAQDAATKDYVDNAIPAAGANTALSNLASTAVNANINPDTDGIRGLGTDILSFGGIYAYEIVSGSFNGRGDSDLFIGSGTSLSGPGKGINFTGGNQPAGEDGGDFVFVTSNTTGIGISGDYIFTTGTSNTTSGSYDLRTGNATTGSADSGGFNFQSGTAAGTRGDFTINTRRIVLNASDFIDADNNLISNVTDPSSAQDAATKNYVDNNFVSVSSIDSARAHSSTTTISGTLATIVYSTEDYDDQGSYNNTTGVFTAAFDGKYQVNASLLITGTIALNDTLIIEIQKQSSVYARGTLYVPAGLTNVAIDISDTVNLNAGQTIRIQVSSSSTAPSIVSSAFDNYLSICKVA